METSERFIDCENRVHWAGEFFEYAPGQIISLPESVARAREEAGLVTILKASIVEGGL